MLLFDDKDEPAARTTDEVGGDAPAILCAACRRRVTTTGARIEMMGLHAHTCVNPAGLSYRIGCFAIVVGCEIVSNPSSEWSWFPGWRWQVEQCGGCRTHLGWKFIRNDSAFHGLILDRLTEA